MPTQSIVATETAVVYPDSKSIITTGETQYAYRIYNSETDTQATAYFKWAADAAGNKYNVITSVKLKIYAYGALPTLPEYSTTLWITTLLRDWQAEKLLDDTGNYYEGQDIKNGYSSPYQWREIELPFEKPMSLQKAIVHGISMRPMANGYWYYYTASSDYKPQLIVTTSDDLATGEITDFAPASGTVLFGQDNTFTFSFAQKSTEQSIAPLEITEFKIQWREHGGTTINAITVTSWAGDAPNCKIKAGTFTGTSVDWRVVATTNAAQTLTSDWMTIETTETTPTARVISPNGITLDATVVNRFRWRHIVASGTAQTKADLQWSADGTTWNTLTTVTGENQYYDVPANTFASGTKYWRVRTYNTDGTASEWSAAAEFIAINAPSAPSIVIQSTGPRPRITWQTSEQEAYQLTLSNGYASGTVYGTDKSWRSPVYLADGSYTVRVRVQNQYGLWSDWGSAALPVSHTEGEAITLTAAGSHVAALDWQTAGSYDFYIVERDGVAIARTTQTSYIDHTSIGSVNYQVRGCYADSDSYGVSSAVTVSVLPDTVMVCNLESGTWQRLPLSETILRTSRTNRTATIQTVHLAGLDYPVAERSEFRDRALQISCAFLRTNRAAALALEALVGRLVCAKTKQGDMAVGYITALEKNADEIMSRYSFEITHIYRREAITLDS